MATETFDRLNLAADRYVSDVMTDVEQVLGRLPERERAVARAAMAGALDTVQAAMVAFEADVIAVATVTVD